MAASPPDTPGCPSVRVANKNVAGQQSDERSILSLFRDLIALRREEPCLREGDQQPLRSQNDVLAFRRARNGDALLVLLNIAAEPRRWHWQGHGRLLISTHVDRPPLPLPDAALLLRGSEGVIIAVEPPKRRNHRLRRESHHNPPASLPCLREVNWKKPRPRLSPPSRP